MITTITTSLEDLRNGTFFETRAEFARRIGVTEQTYRRLLTGEQTVTNPTKRQIAARLELAPQLIRELVPPPSAARIQALTAVVDDANASQSWAELHEDGTMTPAPGVQCVPDARDG